MSNGADLDVSAATRCLRAFPIAYHRLTPPARQASRVLPRALLFQDATFDKVLSVHTLYFWDPLQPHLREMFRVLKPGGRLMLVFRPAEDVTVTAAFPAEIYRFRTLEDVCAELGIVGLDILAVEQREEPGAAMIWLLGERPAVKLPDNG